MNSRPDEDVFAKPREVTALTDCHFYHAFEIPGYGLVPGDWDLRDGVDEYLGHIDVAGKRVFELGTADGFFTFEMERRGAEVVSYDLSPDDRWDVVPFARSPDPGNRSLDGDWVLLDTYSDAITTLNNAYWLAHRAFRSNAKMVHGDVYSIPAGIGTVDISTVGAVLLHTRDPFRVLEGISKLTRDSIVVTEYPGRLAIPVALRWIRDLLPPRLLRPAMRFTPDARTGLGADGWWRLSPEIVRAFLAVLGFGRSELTFHHQLHKGRRLSLFTVVAHRTTPLL